MDNPAEQRVLDLSSIFGLTARITTPAEDTGGAYVEMDCTASPGSGTMVHYHPRQEESYHVLEGTLTVLRDGKWVPVVSGQTVTISPGAVHAFRNESTAPVRFRNRHTPALGFQAHLETLDRLVRAGKVRGTSDPRSIMHMSMSAVVHEPDVPVKPPYWLVRMMAFLGRRLGYSLDA